MPALCLAGAEGIPLALTHSWVPPWSDAEQILGPVTWLPTAAVLTTPAGDKGSQGTKGAWDAHKIVL